MRFIARRFWASHVVAMIYLCLWLAGDALASDDLTHPIRVSSDGHFLVQPDGSPFFWLGDTAWSLFMRLNRDETDEYLKDRAAKGFTVIQAVVMGGPADRLDVPNREGALPLLHRDPRSPNPKYFEHVDWVVDRAAHYGLRIAMLPVWGSAIFGGYLEDSQDHVFDPKTSEAYGRWIAQRYRNKGIIWILGGDTNPVGVSTVLNGDKILPPTDLTIRDFRPLYDSMAKGIIEGEGGKPMISYHLTCCSWLGTAKPRTSLYLGDRSWLSINMLQSSHFRNPGSQTLFPGVAFAWDGTRNYEPIRDEYDSVPARPVIDGEPRYEDLTVDVETNPKAIASKGYWTAYDARNAAYHAVFAGAAGHTYGDASVWQFYDPSHFPAVPPVREGLTWRKALQQPGADQMRYLKYLILSRPYLTRIPDQSVLVNAAGDGEEHVEATRDKSGDYMMIYTPKGEPVEVDLSKLNGLRAVGWWFDPRSGVATRTQSEVSTTGTMRFSPPSGGSDADWVLVLDDASRGFSAPGLVPHS